MILFQRSPHTGEIYYSKIFKSIIISSLSEAESSVFYNRITKSVRDCFIKLVQPLLNNINFSIINIQK